MSQDVSFLLGGGSGGSGGAPSGPAGGDLAGTYPNPTVGGAHFGGIDGQYMIRRTGLWAPATPAYADLSGAPAALPPNGPGGGDLGGTYPSPTVTGAHFGGLDGQYMIRRTGVWAPATPAYADLTGTPAALPPNGPAGGDLAGTYPNPTVASIRNLAAGNGVSPVELTAPDVIATGLTGSVAASRYVGATATGAPTTGAHLVGDFSIDQTGKIWVCTVAGTPGTFVNVGAGGTVGALTNGAQSLTLNADGTLAAVASAATLGAIQTNVTSQFISGNNVRGYVRITVSGTAVAANATFCIVQFSAALSTRAYIVLSPIVTTNAQYGDSVGPIGILPAVAAFLTQAAQTAPSAFSVATSVALVASTSYAFIYHVFE